MKRKANTKNWLGMNLREMTAHGREYDAIVREHARIKAARKALGRRIAKLNARADREYKRTRWMMGPGQTSRHYCTGIRLRP